MIRFLLFVVITGGAFAGGFYAGTRYRDQQFRDKPEEMLKLYGDELKKTAHEKYERLKAALAE
jgi:hypothetical protein